MFCPFSFSPISKEKGFRAEVAVFQPSESSLNVNEKEKLFSFPCERDKFDVTVSPTQSQKSDSIFGFKINFNLEPRPICSAYYWFCRHNLGRREREKQGVDGKKSIFLSRSSPFSNLLPAPFRGSSFQLLLLLSFFTTATAAAAAVCVCIAPLLSFTRQRCCCRCCRSLRFVQEKPPSFPLF